MFNIVDNFEKTVAEFFNAPFSVSTDCCTHAIELCLRLKGIKTIKIPTHTYLSVPMTAVKLNLNWSWEENNWKDFYILSNTNIIDAAVYWQRGGYIKNTLMCLSFQYRKHLGLGRGGMILLDNEQERNELVKMAYDGRQRHIPWMDQEITSVGYHYYMTPETAELGLKKFNQVKDNEPKLWSYKDYPDLSTMEIFKNYVK
jgi:dTDP-4-amino-4,6-dideoxygalactose transaminase